tara:strand:+ start:159 stop:401 length:243 start_codon:yes stop_codon:yes gene_type:complete
MQVNKISIEIPKSFKGLVVGNVSEDIQNIFSGEVVTLEPVAVAMYDAIKGAEILEDYSLMRTGLTWFRKHYPSEFMALLD